MYVNGISDDPSSSCVRAAKEILKDLFATTLSISKQKPRRYKEKMRLQYLELELKDFRLRLENFVLLEDKLVPGIVHFIVARKLDDEFLIEIKMSLNQDTWKPLHLLFTPHGPEYPVQEVKVLF